MRRSQWEHSARSQNHNSHPKDHQFVDCIGCPRPWLVRNSRHASAAPARPLGDLCQDLEKKTLFTATRLAFRPSELLDTAIVRKHPKRSIQARKQAKIRPATEEMHVGPRPGADESGETTPGVLVVTPLRLEDLRPRDFRGFPTQKRFRALGV